MPAAGRTPWHLWAVGGVGLLWNGFGLTDFALTMSQGETWLRSMGMTDPQIDYFNAMPAWAFAVWALGVGTAFLGSVLLLLKRRWAVHAFALSLVGLVLSALYTFAWSNGAEVMGSAVYMQIVVWAGALFFAAYAGLMAKRGLLR
jgi:hypothetical protein